MPADRLPEAVKNVIFATESRNLALPNLPVAADFCSYAHKDRQKCHFPTKSTDFALPKQDPEPGAS